MKRHRVTRHCKSGKCVTYWRGKEGSRRFGEGSEFEKKFSSSRVNRINRAYDEAGVSAPKGKGIHTVAFHERATAIMGSMKKGNKPVNRNMAYAIAMKQLGRKKSVLKPHRR
ncbi:hypothetical protein BS162P1_00027 [Bacteroides phage BS162P1]|jgi:hypothetical protein|nr:hypothetical protein BS162P1_00027 [Bacteroides phage BS162P1]